MTLNSSPRRPRPLVGRAAGLSADRRLDSLRFIISLLEPVQLAALDAQAVASFSSPKDLRSHLRRTTPESRVLMFAFSQESNYGVDVFSWVVK